MPGTFGSLAGLLLFYCVKDSWGLTLSLALSVTALGFLISGKAEKLFGRKDPSCIVIDEVSGMLLCLLFVPHDIKYVIAAFFLFRIFDTLKPFPAGRLQVLKGSLGIMIDDIIAAIYAGVLLQVVFRLAAFKTS
ncbi:MAG: phosphatidylglycerophosphatase A [Candidatus Omnitrophota bacterium]